MITTLHIKNFKSLRDVRLKLGALNIFIGTNASGKSNFLDALRVLQGIGNGFTVSEIFDGKPQSATSERWEGIRGGSSQVTFRDKINEPVSFEVETETPKRPDHPKPGIESYKIAFDTYHLKVVNEQFKSGASGYEFGPKPLHAKHFFRIFHSPPQFSGTNPQEESGPDLLSPYEQPALIRLLSLHYGQTAASVQTTASRFARSLANMQRIDPTPSVLRDYSRVQNVLRMGERGENFAALIQKICDDPATKEAYLSWLKELRPAEVDDVLTITVPMVGDKIFALREGTRNFPAPVLSDGTLRFAAIAAAFFQPDMPGFLTIEEIENGIHASRLRLLVELLGNRSLRPQTQVFITTHSPLVLDWLQEQDYAHTFLCKRDEKSGESKILPLTEIPRFNDIVKKQPVRDLFAEGWMEAAL